MNQFQDREEGMPSCKPIDNPKQEKKWLVIPVQYAAFADAKA